MIKCSGHHQPTHTTPDAHVDPQTGVAVQEVNAVVTIELVQQHVGKSPYRCECHAWSPHGKAKSQPATIEIACEYHTFIRRDLIVLEFESKTQPIRGKYNRFLVPMVSHIYI